MMRALSLTSVAAVLGAGVSPVHAQHSVNVAASVERVENPLLSNVSQGGATVLQVSPSYTLETQNDRSRSRLSLGAVLERSSNTAILASRNFPSVGYVWDHSWPTAEMGLRANVGEAATRETDFQDFGRVTTDSRQRTIVVGALWNQELSARQRLILNATNTRVSYDSPSLVGYRELEISSRLSWEATGRINYFFEPAYVRLTPSAAGEGSSQSRLLVGVRGELTPEWALTAQIGKARVGGARQFSGYMGGGQITFTGSRWSTDIEWISDLAASGASAGYIKTDSVGLRFGYRISEGVTLSTRLTSSRSSGELGSRGTLFGLTLENDLSPSWRSTLGLEERRSEDRIGNAGKGASFKIGLVYVYPGR